MKSLRTQFLLRMVVVLMFLFAGTWLVSVAMKQQKTPPGTDAKVSVENSLYEALLKQVIDVQREPPQHQRFFSASRAF